MATGSGGRERAVRFLAAARWTRLLGSARAAGGGADAEDAVQDVLERLAGGAGSLPEADDALTAYAATAVRRRALELASRRLPIADGDEAVASPDSALERIEARRGLRAYAQAVGNLPARARAVLVLDAAGWSRGQVATRLGTTERSVKRVLDEHRAPVLATTTRALDGSDCTRLRESLDAHAATGLRPRRGGPVAEHLAICDACRAGLARARATRAALRVLLPPPGISIGIAPTGAATAAAGGLAAKWAAVTVVVATSGVAGYAGLHAGDHHAPVPRARPIAAAHRVPAPRPSPRPIAVRAPAHRVVIVSPAPPIRVRPAVAPAPETAPTRPRSTSAAAVPCGGQFGPDAAPGCHG